MENQEKEIVQEKDLIDITELLSDYLRIFRKMWLWLLIFALAGSAVFYMRARLSYTPFYTASATFTINIQKEQQAGTTAGTTAFYDNTTAKQMAQTFPYILTSGVLKRQVAKDMGMAVTGNIQATVAENTNLFTISVTDRDAETAYLTLQSVIENYPEISEVIVGKTYMEMLDETGIPAKPDNPRDFKGSAVKGAILGILVVAAWAALLVVTRRTVRKESDVNRWMNTKCLGTIPQIRFKRRSKGTKKNLLLTDPQVEEAFQEPLRIVRNKIEQHAKRYNNKTFLFTSALAGEGKSTIAVNFALSLAQAGHKVALIDCDLRHPSDRAILGLEMGPGLGEVLQKKAKLSECILTEKEIGMDDSMKFRFLPGGESMEDGAELLGTRHMQIIIDAMENWADYVILDSAPAGLLTDAVVLAQYADSAVIVVRKDFARVDSIMDGMEHLAESKIQIAGGIINGV